MANSPLTNWPMKCPVFACNQVHWTYNFDQHYLDCHPRVLPPPEAKPLEAELGFILGATAELPISSMRKHKHNNTAPNTVRKKWCWRGAQPPDLLCPSLKGVGGWSAAARLESSQIALIFCFIRTHMYSNLITKFGLIWWLDPPNFSSWSRKLFYWQPLAPGTYLMTSGHSEVGLIFGSNPMFPDDGFGAGVWGWVWGWASSLKRTCWWL